MGEKILNKKETFEKYQKLSGSFPPIIMGIQEVNLQEAVQLAIAEQYIQGYRLGKKKYKRFKSKFIKLQFENEKLKEENEKLKKDNESLQDKQIATINRLNFMTEIDKASKSGVVSQKN